MKVRCLKCGYEWETRSTHYYVSCPSCLNKVQIKVIDKQKKIFEKGEIDETK